METINADVHIDAFLAKVAAFKWLSNICLVFLRAVALFTVSVAVFAILCPLLQWPLLFSLSNFVAIRAADKVAIPICSYVSLPFGMPNHPASQATNSQFSRRPTQHNPLQQDSEVNKCNIV